MTTKTMIIIALCQTPLHGHRLRACCTTPPTDKLTTTLYNMLYNKFATSQCHSPTSRHCQDVGMWQIFVRWWWICCRPTTSCSCELVRWWCTCRSRCPCIGVWRFEYHDWRLHCRKLSKLAFLQSGTPCHITVDLLCILTRKPCCRKVTARCRMQLFVTV